MVAGAQPRMLSCGVGLMRLLRYEPRVPNFGDDLNAVLWPALVPGLFGDGPDQEAFVGIGTIVGLDPGGSRSLHVFSSGAGYAAPGKWAGIDVRYHCVRGPLTAQVLGLPADRALTDGAILVPTLEGFGERGAGAGSGVVVVPHYETIACPGWPGAVRAAGFELVDPRGTPQHVIARLACARLVLTESLHGAILADAFGVPWRAFAVSRNFSTTKWADWTASLGVTADVTMVPPPDPMPLLRYGKRSEPFGAAVTLDPETALREFRGRVSESRRPHFLKAQAKKAFEAVPVARRLLGFGEARTAQALFDLSRGEPSLSAADVRASLRDEMLQRLDGLVRRHKAGFALAE